MIQAKKYQLKKLIYNREAKNIYLSFLFRVGGILCNFLTVPLVIDQLNAVEYGILITVISITTWFNYVDFGLANGLKNKISESLVRGDLANVRKYVTSAYFALFKIIILLSLILMLSSYFINWNELIKGPLTLHNEINKLFFWGVLLFFFKIIAELINPILLAHHLTAISSVVSFISQFLILVLAYVLKRSDSHSFLAYGLLFFWVPLLVFVSTNVYLYLTRFRTISPSRYYFEKEFESNLFQLGGNFFVIQIAVLIIFTTDNLIIGRIFGYSEVSSYNIAFRYFNIPLFILSVALTPFWPVFAESFANGQVLRIKKIINNLLLFWLGIVLMSIVMLVIANSVYSVWIGPKMTIPFMLNLGMFLFCIISGWNSLFATFINSTSKLRLQFLSSIITGIINIPLSIFLAKYAGLGPAGVIFGTCACLLVGSFWAPVQYLKLVNNKAGGIWNK